MPLSIGIGHQLSPPESLPEPFSRTDVLDEATVNRLIEDCADARVRA